MVEDDQLDQIVDHLCEQLPRMVKQTNADGTLTSPPNVLNFKFEPRAVRPVVILALQIARIIPTTDSTDVLDPRSFHERPTMTINRTDTDSSLQG